MNIQKLPNELYIDIFSHLEYDFIKIYEIKYFNSFVKIYGNEICDTILKKYEFIYKKENTFEILKSLAKYNSSYNIGFTLEDLYDDYDDSLKIELLDSAILDNNKILVEFLLDNGVSVDSDYLKGLINC